jgi:LPXTG-motif cell wall-anchored protein
MLQKILKSSLVAPFLLVLAGVASAQSTSTATTTPGIPNTGAEDMIANGLVLGVAALIAVGAAAYLYAYRNEPQGLR